MEGVEIVCFGKGVGGCEGDVVGLGGDICFPYQGIVWCIFCWVVSLEVG